MINFEQHLNSVKSLICLNGEIPDKILFEHKKHLPLIAADGAGSKLIRMGIIPDFIVGDLDSIDKFIAPIKTEILVITDQNKTDFQKCLTIVEQKQLFPCLVYGATGKESDHTVFNLHILAEYAALNAIILHDSAYREKDKYGIFVNDQLYVNLDMGAKISLLCFSHAVVSSKGLTWELDHMQLSATISSTRNIVKTTEVEITVHSGSVLVLFDSRNSDYNANRTNAANNLS